ncbi:MAG: SWF/SNF helicase family protein, partial [Candidatus Dojkabacteria bacterium]|nr:SWF/SNF helicase family protein [Candidatus Dojkabacteria bacterium]
KVISVFKVDSFVEMLTEFEDKKRLVIFCHHNEVVEKLCNLIKKHYPHVDLRTIYGKTSNQERAITTQAFQGDSDDFIWLITSFSVGSEGLTLTKADTILFLELDWSISTLLQAEDRIHRISQTKVCMYYYYIALNTLDQYMYNVLYKKAKYLEEFSDKASYIKKITETEKENNEEKTENCSQAESNNSNNIPP